MIWTNSLSYSVKPITNKAQTKKKKKKAKHLEIKKTLSCKNYTGICDNEYVTYENNYEKAKALIRGKYIALDTLCYKIRI